MTDIKKTDDLVEDANQLRQEQSQLHNISGVKTKNNRFKMGLLFGFAAILILAILALKIYKNFYAEEPPTASTAKTDENASQVGKVRTGMGQNFDPVANEAASDSVAQDTGNSTGSPDKPAVTQFQKYLSIPVSGQSGSSSERRSDAGTAQQDDTSTGEQQPQAKAVTASRMQVSAIKMDPDLYIEQNTIIPCALTTRFVSDVGGRINCVITEDVWSANHHTKLIEKGTKAFGSYKTGTLNHGQGRMFIIWNQLRTPDFKRIDLVDTAAAGALGEMGIDGWIDTHFWDRFGGAMLVGMIPDAMQALSGASKNNKDNQTDYTANSREAFAEIAKEAAANSVNIPPTMYKNQGDIISILVGDDIDFSGIYQLRAK
ncbi:TrbI/VirB10 family protein [Salmonella enterica]|nr:TrbI/VirB10 family protein [Salmonella enterica]EBR4768343.1 TrbI/VirB10 family protein [Salmonella enterica]